MLIRERHLGNVLTRLLASHEFHVCGANVARDIIFRGMRQPLSLSPSLSCGSLVRIREGLLWDPLFWAPLVGDVNGSLQEDLLFSPPENNANMASPPTLGPIIECILYRKYYRHYSSIVFSTLTIIYWPTHINRKGLAKPKVKLPNYSQLGIKAFCHQNFSLPLHLAADLLSPSPKWTILLLPPTFPSPSMVQPSRLAIYKLLLLVFFHSSNNLRLQNT